jgi:hypothetical protein
LQHAAKNVVHVDDLKPIPEISYYEEAHSNDQELHKMVTFFANMWKAYFSQTHPDYSKANSAVPLPLNLPDFRFTYFVSKMYGMYGNRTPN